MGRQEAAPGNQPGERETNSAMGPLVAKRDNDTSRVITLVTVPDATGKQTIKHVVAAPSEAMPMHQQFLVPNPDRCGTTWRRFVALLESMGYAGDRRVIKICDFGAPASRDRQVRVLVDGGFGTKRKHSCCSRNSFRSARYVFLVPKSRAQVIFPL